jgi:hypothetical protein
MSTTKTGFAPITVPVVKPVAPAAVKPTPPAAPAKISNAERLEKQLVGKYFAFIFAGGTAFKAGKIESIISDSLFGIRYLRDGKLLKFVHIVRHYDAPSIENMTGLLLFDTEDDLMSGYETVIKPHLAEQRNKPQPAKTIE